MEDSLRALSIKYVIGIALVLPILYYFLYFKAPNEMSLISDSEQQLILLDGEIKKLDREIAEGDQFKQNLEIVKKEIKALATYFEARPNAKTIEQIISEEARATGISFTTLQPVSDLDQNYQVPIEGNQAPTAENFIKRSLIKASFSGTFIELMRFLSYLSRTDRVVSLKNIQLRTAESNLGPMSGDNIKLLFEANFETYEIIKDVNTENLAPPPVPVEAQ